MVLLAILHHDKYGTVQIRVQNEREGQRWVGHGWRLIGYETWSPLRKRR